MKPCTSINVLFDPTFRIPVEEQIQRVYDAGFRHMDMNFWDWAVFEQSPFRQDDCTGKPNSLVADFDLIADSAAEALKNRQIQPILRQIMTENP